MKTSNPILIKFYTTATLRATFHSKRYFNETTTTKTTMTMTTTTTTTMSFNSAINFVIIRFYYLIINFNYYKK